MALAFLIALGVRIIEVERLGRDARYLPDLRVLLLDIGLSDDERERVSSRVLPHFVSES